MSTKIEWVKNPDGTKGKTWNPITGCSKISHGCAHCYAERMAQRLKGRYGYPGNDPFQPGTVHVNKLKEPGRWKKPQRIFVCSMGDLFHSQVLFSEIDRVLNVMEDVSRHTYLLLTKRARNMVKYFHHYYGFCQDSPTHIWWGTTAENQATANERLPNLLEIPAHIRFVSVEPMLAPVNLSEYLGPDRINWVICGGESGPHSRPIDPAWVRDLRDQCQQAGVPFFFKQWGGRDKKAAGRLLDGTTYDEMPMFKRDISTEGAA